METTVVGLDVPPAPVEPLLWAAEYCRSLGCELVGAVAFEYDGSEYPIDWYKADVAKATKRAEAVLDDLAAGIPHRVELREGDPLAVIPDVAGDEHAGLVVVGARGNGGFHGLGLGTVAHHVSHHLFVPVVIVPALGGPLRGSPVVVGMDGSPGDLVTLEWALHLAEAVEGSINAVYASDPMSMSYPHPRGATVADQNELAVRRHAAGVARSARVEVTVTVEVDHPVTALARVAEQVGASLIVVGHKGAGHLRGHVLGRVPAKLPFLARRPVAIVPRPARD